MTAEVVIRTSSRTIPTSASASFQAAAIRISNAAYAGVVKTSSRVEKSALKLVPVRKVFKGGRRSGAARQRSVAEAKADINDFLAAFPTQPGGRRTTRAKAYSDLRASRISTSRNRANSFAATGTNVLDEQGNFVGAKPRIGPGGTKSSRSVNIIETMPHTIVVPGGNKVMLPGGTATALVGGEYGLSGEGRYQLHGPRGGSGIGPGVYTGERTTLGGALRDSIQKFPDSNETVRGMTIEAGGHTAPYARYVEFGTRHAAAQPFLRPALAQHGDMLVSDIITALERIGMVAEEGR